MAGTVLERVFDNLSLEVDPFATCRLADGWRLRLPLRDWVTFHFTLSGTGELLLGGGERMALRGGTLAVMPPNVPHAIECGKAQRETGREFIPTVMLYGRVVEHVPITEAELQAVLQSLGVAGDAR